MCEWVALTRQGVQSGKGGTLSFLPRGEPGGVCTFKGRWGPQEEDALGASRLGGSGRTRKVQGMESKVEKLCRILPRY